jgi:hypothetical protein
MNGHTRFYELVLTDKERVSFLTNLWPTLTRRRSPVLMSPVAGGPGSTGRRSEHTGVAPVTKSVTKRHAISAPHQQIRTLRLVSKALQHKHFTDAHHLGSRGTFRIPATPTRRIRLSSGSRARFGMVRRGGLHLCNMVGDQLRRSYSRSGSCGTAIVSAQGSARECSGVQNRYGLGIRARAILC